MTRPSHDAAKDARLAPRPVLLGGYASKSCARVTHNAYDPTVPHQPTVVPESLQRLFDLGNEHESAVFAVWLAAEGDVVDLRELDEDKQAHIGATLRAMHDQHQVILGGRLPDDPAGGRTGKPDVLLREIGGSGYHPGDVKAHFVLDKKKTLGVVADLAAPALSSAKSSEMGLRYDARDLLQLAHYWRMLEACGQQAASPCGAIVGTDPGPLPQLAWYYLTEPRFTTFSRSQGKASRSSLERYDHEHDFRVLVAQNAQQRTGSASDPEPLVQPVGQEECLTCAWAPVCVDLLPPDDLSRALLGTLSVREYLALRQQGVATIDDLADADVKVLLDSPYAKETSQTRTSTTSVQGAFVSPDGPRRSDPSAQARSGLQCSSQ